MPMDLIDIVYILKPDIVPDELRYSLRSVEANLPHNRVWFVCGQPEGLEPDGRIVHKQTGNSKWAFTRSSMVEIVNNDEITDDFYLFNDDFFVMKPVTEFKNMACGTLEKRMETLYLNYGLSAYGRQVYSLQQELHAKCADEVNYELHVPMLIKKDDMRYALKRSNSVLFRSLYGNLNDIAYLSREDVKVYNLTDAPDLDYLSTTEEVFRDGKVGELIRSTFTKPSRFEV